MVSGDLSSRRLLLGYSTFGLPDHRVSDAATLLAQIGYDAIGLRLHRKDLSGLNQRSLRERLGRITQRVMDKTWVLEADGNYLLDVWSADAPTLLDPDPARRAERERLIARAIHAAAPAQAIVTFSSGARPPHEDHDPVLDRFADSLRRLAALAKRLHVKLALRPATGHLISRIAHFERLLQWVPNDGLYVAADVATMVRGGELPVASLLGRDPRRLACVFVADVGDREGVDLPPGDGHLHWPALLAGIRSAAWSGPVIVRCDVPTVDGPTVARRVFGFLAGLR